MLLLSWTVDVSCVLNLVRVTGCLGCFLGVYAPQNFKENLSDYNVRIYLYVIVANRHKAIIEFPVDRIPLNPLGEGTLR